MMRIRALDLAAAVLTAALLAASWWVWRHGSTGPIPMHFGLDGNVDRWGDRSQAAAVLAAMGVLGAGIYAMIPAMARGAVLTAATRRALVVGQALLLVFMALLGGGMLSIATGLLKVGQDPQLVLRIINAVLAAVLLVTGAVLGKTSPNPAVGVRFYWTFASRLAWEKSNRLLGRILFWAGLAGLIASSFGPEPAVLIVLTIAAIGGAVVSTIEAWRVWRTDPERKSI